MKILLTGASGFLGNLMLEAFLEQPEVQILGTSFTSSPSYKHERLTWMSGDLATKDAIDKLQPCDVVIHSVKSRFHREFPEKALPIFEAHITSTMMLLEWARRSGVKKFILISSGSIYGTKDSGFWSERDLPLPDTFYGASKFAAENIMLNYAQYFDCSILRIFTLYGPGQRGHLFPQLITRVQTGEPVIVSNGEGVFLTPAYSEDVIQVVKEVLKTKADKKLEILNVAGEEHFSIKEIALQIGTLLDKNVVFKTVEGVRQVLQADNTLRKLKFPKINFTPFNVGLKQTLAEFPAST